MTVSPPKHDQATFPAPGTDPPARQRRTTIYLIDQVLLPKS